MSDDTPDKDQAEQPAEGTEGRGERRTEGRPEGRTGGQRRGPQTFEGLGSLRQAMAQATRPTPAPVAVPILATLPEDVQPKRDAFALYLLGDPSLVLPQGMYTLRGREATFENLFIVPIGQDETATEYEAVFT